jgi:hypothetical protein
MTLPVVVLTQSITPTFVGGNLARSADASLDAAV